MTLGTKFKCDHFKGKILEVKKLYDNGKMFVVEDDSNNKHMAVESFGGECKLFSSMIGREQGRLHLVEEPQGEHQW